MVSINLKQDIGIKENLPIQTICYQEGANQTYRYIKLKQLDWLVPFGLLSEVDVEIVD